MKFNLIILYLFLLSFIQVSSSVTCDDGSACPNKYQCCYTLHGYYRCCSLSLDCCEDGMKCCYRSSNFLEELKESVEAQISIIE